MLEALKILLSGGLIYGFCYTANIIGKCIVVTIISHNNNISNEKVEALTKMMSKDININFHQ